MLKKLVLIVLIVIQKKWNFFIRKKNVKITKRKHAFKGYATTYSVEILNSFNPELQLKDTESAIISKLNKSSLNYWFNHWSYY